MKAQVLRADANDAARVLASISRQTLDEYEISGVDPAAAVDAAVRRGDPMFLSVASETPLTLFGFGDYGHYLSMWTIATTAFFDLGVPGVLCTRRFFRSLSFSKPLYVVTTSPREETDRWLCLLGFERVNDDPVRREFRLTC